VGIKGGDGPEVSLIGSVVLKLQKKCPITHNNGREGKNSIGDTSLVNGRPDIRTGITRRRRAQPREPVRRTELGEKKL